MSANPRPAYFRSASTSVLGKKTLLTAPNLTGDVMKTPRQKTWSPMLFRRHTGDSGSSKLRTVQTAESALNQSVEDRTVLDTSADISIDHSRSGDVLSNQSSNGVYVTLDEDSMDGSFDITKVAHEITRIEKKKTAIIQKIEAEQNSKEESVSEYLKQSSAIENVDAQHRIKMQFEKRNQKSALTIANLQQKLTRCETRLAALQQGDIPTDRRRQAREMLRDVGHGLITIVAKPKELASIIKNKFGSADNIHESSGEIVITQPVAEEERKPTAVLSLPSTKLPSDDDDSSLTSGSAPGILAVPVTSGSHHGSSLHQVHIEEPKMQSEPRQQNELEELQSELERQHDTLTLLWKNFDNFKAQQQILLDKLKLSMRTSQENYEMLNCHLVELADMRQSDLTNLNEDIRNMEERMEYRLEERMRDVQDLLENCQTRITKMEMSQQQAQQNSSEFLENSGVRTLFTKLLNVILAVLAVILVLISTAVNVAGPCLNTRVRIVMTVGLVTILFVTYYRWKLIEECGHYALSTFLHSRETTDA